MSLRQENEQLKQQIESLTAQKEALNKKIGLMSNQIANQPQVLSEQVAQQIVDLRDDVEYYTRRLEEAQIELNKCLKANGLNVVNIQVVVKK
ncbi:MAG: hypothetical protein AB1600_00270 [Bacteroidota bacterium]